MILELNPDLDHLNWDRIVSLFSLVEWETRKPEEVKKAFETSSFVCIVKEANEIIGFGRTTDDGKYYAMLVDIVVDPKYQKKGIGKQIVNCLREQLKGFRFITLSAAPGKEGFYQKLGWRKQKSAYIYPIDQKQVEEHCE